MSPGLPLLLLPYSLAVGVGHSRADDEEPLAAVGRPDVGGGDDARLHSIPKPVEVGRNSVQPARHEGPHVFDDHDPGPKLSDDAKVLAPESGAGSVDACPFARDRHVLTGEAATNHLDGGKVARANVAHVRMTGGARPVLREHSAAPRVKLDLPRNGAEPGPFKAKL